MLAALANVSMPTPKMKNVNWVNITPRHVCSLHPSHHTLQMRSSCQWEQCTTTVIFWGSTLKVEISFVQQLAVAAQCIKEKKTKAGYKMSLGEQLLNSVL